MSTVNVHRAGEAFVEPMAAVLAETHRDHSPLGAAHVLADEATALQMVVAALDGGAGYVATNASSVLGFMVAPFPPMPGPTRARLGMAHHAAHAVSARSVYRLLYQAVSADLVSAGITYHSLPVLAENAGTVETFVGLGFGIDQIDGILAVPSDQDTP